MVLPVLRVEGPPNKRALLRARCSLVFRDECWRRGHASVTAFSASGSLAIGQFPGTTSSSSTTAPIASSSAKSAAATCSSIGCCWSGSRSDMSSLERRPRMTLRREYTDPREPPTRCCQNLSRLSSIPVWRARNVDLAPIDRVLDGAQRLLSVEPGLQRGLPGGRRPAMNRKRSRRTWAGPASEAEPTPDRARAETTSGTIKNLGTRAAPLMSSNTGKSRLRTLPCLVLGR